MCVFVEDLCLKICFVGFFFSLYSLLYFLGLPAIIVTISLVVTQANGYGNTEACWLDVKSGLIWAFIAPALLVILVSENLLYSALSPLIRVQIEVQKKNEALHLVKLLLCLPARTLYV